MRLLTTLTSLLLALVLGLAACGGDGDSDDGGSDGTEPRAVSADELRDAVGDLDHPVYWAGERDDASLELTQTKDDAVYVRYLVRDAEPGDPNPQYLTIGSYPSEKAFQEIRTKSKERGARSTQLEGGGLAVVSELAPQSVFFAYPDVNAAGEVFHPSGGEAHRLVVAGEIKPVE